MSAPPLQDRLDAFDRIVSDLAPMDPRDAARVLEAVRVFLELPVYDAGIVRPRWMEEE